MNNIYILVGSDNAVYGKYDHEPTDEEIREILKRVQRGNLLGELFPENIVCYQCEAKKKIGGRQN